MACGNDRPDRTRRSRGLSYMAESLPDPSMIGRIFLISSPNSSDLNLVSRACIQPMLSRSVLISPLCDRYRYGCARAQFGKVLVLKRECTIATADTIAGSLRSG